MTVQEISGVEKLADRFDFFLIDQFGVLHDGSQPFPGAVETLARLTGSGRTTILLSNSGKRSSPNEERLLRLGFKPGSWTHFLSSGEVAWPHLSRSLSGRSKRCLLIARDSDRSAVDGLDIELTEDGGLADIVLLSASEGDRYELDHYTRILEPAARRGVPCLCTNPDKLMMTPVGLRFGAGRIADLYTELGGSVQWIGKPYPEIYMAARELAACGDDARVVCIGDSVEHDIAGGRGAGLATALVQTGIHASMSGSERQRLYDEQGGPPDFLLPAFAW